LNRLNIKRTFVSTPPAQKSRFSRSNAAERHEVPAAFSQNCHVSSDTGPDASQTTRLKELLSPASWKEPPSLKPTPPTVSKISEKSTSNTSTPSTPISIMDQNEARTRECIPLKKRHTHTSVQTASSKTDDQTFPKKHRTHREQTSEKATVKDQTHAVSLSSNSALDHKRPSRKTQSGTHAAMSTRAQRQYDKELRRKRSEAARIIQRAWHR